jgi:hypothetical protein
MEVGNELHCSDALTFGIELLIHIEYDADWAPGLVTRFCRCYKALAPFGESKYVYLVVEPVD